MTGPHRGAPRHYGEELQDLIDDRLTEPLRSEVEGHVQDCARCRRELEALRWVKSAASKHATAVELPEELPVRVRSALDAEDRGWQWRRVPRRAWIVGALAAAAILIVFFRGHKSPPLTTLVAEDFQAINAGRTRLEIESADPKVMEAHFARSGIEFPTRVFDLAMMRYQLAGGRVHELDGRTSALFAYRGPDNVWLVCQMYEGNVTELPVSSDVRVHNGITFHVHRDGDLTLVFWQEGNVVCVLTSDAPAEDVVQLAFAKAVRVDPPPRG